MVSTSPVMQTRLHNPLTCPAAHLSDNPWKRLKFHLIKYNTGTYRWGAIIPSSFATEIRDENRKLSHYLLMFTEMRWKCIVIFFLLLFLLPSPVFVFSLLNLLYIVYVCVVYDVKGNLCTSEESKHLQTHTHTHKHTNTSSSCLCLYLFVDVTDKYWNDNNKKTMHDTQRGWCIDTNINKQNNFISKERNTQHKTIKKKTSTMIITTTSTIKTRLNLSKIYVSS